MTHRFKITVKFDNYRYMHEAVKRAQLVVSFMQDLFHGQLVWVESQVPCVYFTVAAPPEKITALHLLFEAEQFDCSIVEIETLK